MRIKELLCGLFFLGGMGLAITFALVVLSQLI